MKRKSILVGLLSLTAILGLASCGENNSTGTPTSAPTSEPTSAPTSAPTSTPTSTPSTTVNPEEEAKEIINSALSQLNIDENIESDSITLATIGIRGVHFTYTSSNPDVISISEGNATVNRPAFGEDDESVTITVTAIYNEYELSKEIKVTVKAMSNQAITVSEIKASTMGTKVFAQGVVSGFLYSSSTVTNEDGSTKNVESKAGFYLTDSTGTIYVYGSITAATVEIGNEIYLSGIVNEHNSSIQISSPSNLKVLNESASIDWTNVVKDKSIVEVKNLGAQACGNVYELTVLVYKNSYNNYAIEDIDYATSKVSLNEYFSGTISQDFTGYAPWLKGKEGQILKVYFMVNSVNGSGVPRGNVLKVLPLSDEEQVAYISNVLPSAISLDNKYTESTSIDLPTSIEGYESLKLNWSLSENSTGATITDNKLEITPTDSLQKFILTVTATKEGSDPITYTYEEVQVKSSFEPISFEQYNALENKENAYIEGKLVLTSGRENYFVDKNGNFYLVYGNFSNIEVGKVYYVNGSISIYNGLRELANATFEESSTEITIPVAKDITENASVYSSDKAIEDALQNQYVKITGVATGETELTVNGTTIALYGKNNITLKLTTGHTYTIVGYASLNRSKTQIVVYSNDDVVETELTPEQKVNETIAAIKAQFTESFTASSTEVTLKNDFNLTLEITLGEGTILKYENGVVTVTATETEATQTFTIKVSTGTGVLKEDTITVTSLLDSSTTVTTKLNFPSSTTNLSETDSALNAQLLGLDSDIFEVIYTVKNKSNISKIYTDFRFYSGDTLTIKVKEGKKYTIKSVSATASETSGNYSLEKLIVTANGSAVTGTNGSYTINATELVLSNSAQVRFTALSFVYDVVTE